MKPIYVDSALVEKIAKDRYCIPENLMMENAAANLEIVLNTVSENFKKPVVYIACGTGNNGADGIALSRRIHEKMDCKVYLLGEPKTTEGQIQYKMAKAIGVQFLTFREFITGIENLGHDSIIIDCIFGTGFHGTLEDKILELINAMNQTSAIRIACDIPSGLAFNAHYTVTMGALKTQLFSDKAKDKVGEILIADLGISSKDFELCGKTNIHLIEKSDLQLPFRNEKSSHKGKYGHTCVFAGEKSGAGIIAATSALNFGSGLVSLLKTDCSNIEQFKIDPQLMISTSIPTKTTCISIGSGLGKINSINHPSIKLLLDWFGNHKSPSVVLDADILTSPIIPELLTLLTKKTEAKIILTPHLGELASLSSIFELKIDGNLTEVAGRCEFAEKFISKYNNVTLIMKSANTIIACKENNSLEFFIVADGGPSLAKAGSGDVLCGLTAALLAQNYDAKSASITASEAHALASGKANSYCLTTEELIHNLQCI